MDISMITSFISSVGFPIVCCIYMICTLNKSIDSMKESLTENTMATSKMCDLINLLMIKNDKEPVNDEINHE